MSRETRATRTKSITWKMGLKLTRFRSTLRPNSQHGGSAKTSLKLPHSTAKSPSKDLNVQNRGSARPTRCLAFAHTGDYSPSRLQNGPNHYPGCFLHQLWCFFGIPRKPIQARVGLEPSRAYSSSRDPRAELGESRRNGNANSGSNRNLLSLVPAVPRQEDPCRTTN
jgi:hypothetical protein